jgi:hypothetical protein
VATNPDLRVLLVTGQPDAVAPYGTTKSAMPYVLKPFTAQTLVGKVREVLGVA